MRQLNGAYYGICESAGNASTKLVTIPGFDLTVGVSVLVRFTTTNSTAVNSLTLNINGTGAIPIKRYGTVNLSKPEDIQANSICNFVYDGTNWVWVGHINTDTNTDEKVRQILTSTDNEYPLLFSNAANNSTTTNHDGMAYRNNSIYANPSTGAITAANFIGSLNGHTLDADVPSNAKFTDTTYGVVTNGGLEMSGTDFKIKNKGVTNAMLANSSMSIAGSSVSLGGTLDAATLKTALGITGAMHYIGQATVAVTDGGTQDPKINGNITTLTAGDVIRDKDGAYEYIWDGAKWEKLGGDGDYVIKGTTINYTPAGTINNHTFTPAGSVSQPTFTGTQGSISLTGSTTGVAVSDISYTPAGNISQASSGTATYTPAGTVSAPTFTGTAGNVSVSGTPNGSVAVTTADASSGENYTPKGTISAPTFTGSATTSTGTYKPKGSISVTPTVTLNTTTVNSITEVGTLPSLTMTVDDNETLTWTWSAGTLPTKGGNTTVATTVKSATATGSFTGTEETISVSGTPSGSVTAPTFTGQKTKITATFTGSASSATGSFTPAGSVSQPSFTGTGARLVFTGTAATLKHTVTQGSVSVSGNFTPAGTVSKPTFTGTEASLSHTFSGTAATITIN